MIGATENETRGRKGRPRVSAHTQTRTGEMKGCEMNHDKSSRTGRIPPGTKFGRWTTIRSAGFREQSGKRRARCVVQCVCGHEQTAYEYMLRGGKTTGCTSRKCLARFEAGEQLRPILVAQVDATIEAFVRGEFVEGESP